MMEEKCMVMENKNEIILHGSDGKLIRATTSNQRKILLKAYLNDMILLGPAWN